MIVGRDAMHRVCTNEYFVFGVETAKLAVCTNGYFVLDRDAQIVRLYNGINVFRVSVSLCIFIS